MIIQCLCCGKSVSSKTNKCPYCLAEVNNFTLEKNGLEVNESLRDKVYNLVLGLVHK